MSSLCSYSFGHSLSLSFFFFNDTATTEIYTLSLHDALPIFTMALQYAGIPFTKIWDPEVMNGSGSQIRSEEHTSELQSRLHLVCRLLLEKKKNNKDRTRTADAEKAP